MFDYNRYDLSKVEDCAQFLPDSDEELGRLRGAADAAKYIRDARHAQAFLDSEGSVAERNAKADLIIAENGTVDDYKNAIADYEIMKAKRFTADTTIQIWRTKTSARGKGIL